MFTESVSSSLTSSEARIMANKGMQADAAEPRG